MACKIMSKESRDAFALMNYVRAGCPVGCKLLKDALDNGLNPNVQDHIGNTLLHYAVSWKLPQYIPMLIDAGAKLNTKNRFGHAPLHFCHEHTNIDCIKLLLDSGANINVRDDDGDTALHWAARGNNELIVKMLLESGINKSIKGSNRTLAEHIGDPSIRLLICTYSEKYKFGITIKRAIYTY